MLLIQEEKKHKELGHSSYIVELAKKMRPLPCYK